MPLYHGPFVKIRVTPSDDEYNVSKPLFCKESSYFAAMFEREFTEGQTQTVDMKELDGLVSSQSITALIQWLYHRRVRFNTEHPEEQITTAIELSRLADMCDVQGVGADMAEFIKDVLIANPKPYPSRNEYNDLNTHSITDEHIDSATFLPQGHPVRCITAAASVEGLFKSQKYKFAEQARKQPTFGADLLEAVRGTLCTLTYSEYHMRVRDPVTGEQIRVNSTWRPGD